MVYSGNKIIKTNGGLQMKQIKKLQSEIMTNNKLIKEHEQTILYLELVYRMDLDEQTLTDIWDTKMKVWTLESANEINEKFIKIIIDNLDDVPESLWKELVSEQTK